MLRQFAMTRTPNILCEIELGYQNYGVSNIRLKDYHSAGIEF